MTASKPRPVAWSGPDDAWRESDAVLAAFLDSFTAKDVPRLKTEGRVRDIRQPRGTAVSALRAAIDDPTVAKWRNLQRFHARDLAAAMRALNYSPTNETNLTRHLSGITKETA